MADVTGDLNGQPIQLNNAATEATLKQLLQATLAMLASQGKSKSTQQKIQSDLEKELRRLAAASKKTAAQIDKDANTKAAQAKKSKELEDKKNKLTQETIKGLQSTIDDLDGLQRALTGAVSAISSSTSAIAGMGNSMSAAASAMGAIPVVGGVLASVLGTVAAAAEKSYKAFQQSASVGANFGGSINDMIGAATNAGMTIDGFSALVAKNGEGLALFGAGVNDGAKRFADLAKRIRSSEFKDLNANLANLGYSTEDVNSGMIRYQTMMAKTGKGAQLSNEELIASTGQYLQNLDAVSKLTGKSKEALQKEEDARTRDAQYQVAKRKLDKDSQDNLEMLMGTMTKTEQEAFKGALATGTMNEAMVKLNVVNPMLAKELMNTALQTKQSGKLTKDAAIQLDTSLTSAAKAGADNTTAQVVAAHQAATYGDTYNDANERAARTTTMSEQLAKQQEELEKQRIKREQDLRDGMDPESMKRFQENIAELSNRFTKLAGEFAPKLIQAFDFIEKTLVGPLGKAFELIADHLGKLVTVVGLVAVAMTAFKLKLKYEQGKAAMRGTPKDPMFVQDVNGGGGPSSEGNDRRKKRTQKVKSGRALQNAGGLIKGVGVVGAVAGVATMASDLSDISNDVKEGKITEAEASEKRGGAIGGGAGGAAGAWGGAAAGAAIGSIVPVIGTAVGGLLGGAIGYFVGNKAGEVVGEKIGKAVAPVTKATKEQTAATKEATEQAETLTKEQKKATEAAKTPPKQPDWYKPESTLAYYRDTMKAPGASAVTPSTPSASSGDTVGAAPPINQDAQKNLELIKNALVKQGITDPKMIAATLGNVMKESGGKTQSENLNYKNTSNDRIRSIFKSATKGKSDAEIEEMKASPEKMAEANYGSTTKLGAGMGNTEPGDGWKFRGRGFIQLTGRNNYATASKAIFGDDRLVKNPDLANDPTVAAEISAWYMKRGNAGMAKKMGIDQNNMTQAQANALATSTIAGTDVTKAGGYLGGEVMGKVNKYAGSSTIASIAGAPFSPSAPATTVAQTAVTPAVPATTTTAALAATNKPAASTPAKTQTQTASATPVGQELPSELLMRVNTNLEVLIALTKTGNEKQLRATNGMSGNLFASV